ncbi:aldehyde dehydrogenase family 16 member A1 [Ixodes scapularis]|uniref:aldehyde dehydrogenase family 16 member A1 n=1 Tax=Ixodes scapularis TaxID=6945 RepID=UPI001A9F6A97|nr:aldehyde dehydrogenase family 16 member A1 [Ixodes scapularis]
MASGLTIASSDKGPNTVKAIFESPRYGPVMESYDVAHAWIKSHGGRFARFVGGKFVAAVSDSPREVKDPVTGVRLGLVDLASAADVCAAFVAAREAQASWARLGAYQRSNCLYSMARSMEKHTALLALVESLQSGKTLSEARTRDMAYLTQSLFVCASWLMRLKDSIPCSQPRGVVGVVVDDPSAVAATAAWRVAEVLATGCAAVLLVRPEFCLSALAFAEVLASVGLPKGLFNVLPVPENAIAELLRDAAADAVFVIGRARTGFLVRQALAGRRTSFSSFHASRHVAVVLEGADLHSAACGVSEAFARSCGKGEASGLQVFVQESVHGTFSTLLTERFSRLRVGLPNDKTADLSCFSPLPCEPYSGADVGKMPGAVTADVSGIAAKCPTVPVLLPDVAPSSAVVDAVGLPVLLVTRFRTPKEAVSLVNCVRGRTGVCLWTENLACALELATQFRVASVFVNMPPTLDPAAEFGGVGVSGVGRVGGRQGLLTFLKPAWSTEKPIVDPELDWSHFGSETRPDRVLPTACPAGARGEDETFELFYAGQRKKPESSTSYPVHNSEGKVVGFAPEAGRKDVRNAVEAAVAGFKSWSTREAPSRARVLYRVAENLSLRAKEFASRLGALEGLPADECDVAVSTCIRRLFYWAATCYKGMGSVRSATSSGGVMSIKEPLGVIGVVCSDSAPLLSFVTLVAAALATGNTVVALASQSSPLSALHMCEVFSVSDVPAGVVNVLSGLEAPLVRTLAEHHDLAAVWYHGESDLAAAFVERAAAHSGKATWLRDASRDWEVDDHCSGRLFAAHGTSTKSVWLPSGQVFAN